jgi:hypothetical protein
LAASSNFPAFFDRTLAAAAGDFPGIPGTPAAR